MRFLCLSLPLVMICFINGFGQNAQPSAKSIDNDSIVFIKVDNPPSFPGGMEGLANYLGKNVKFPKDARKQRVNGTVYVMFVVNEDGSIDDKTVKVFEGGEGNLPKSLENPACREEATRVVKDGPNWIPGTHEGKPVKARFILPIKFKS